ncbi:MAG TPA: methyltransferase domain-containing protein [Methylophilaceae bacterium]|jgi:SAM-dependent methyltransferase
MHNTALQNADYFFKTYLDQSAGKKVVEIGSQDVNGSIRQVCPKDVDYIGLDFVEGKGVDIVLTDPYQLPLSENSVDYVVSSSVFEHSEMFWVLFIEILRVLKPDGLFYLNAPSNGMFHRYPVDCWRFYPDSGNALVKWAEREGLQPALLESYTSYQDSDYWNDFVSVFIKDVEYVEGYQKRIVDTHNNFYNGLVYGSDEFINFKEITQDQLKIQAIRDITNSRLVIK